MALHLVTQLRLTLVTHGLQAPRFSVHEFSRLKILEWVAIPTLGFFSGPRNEIQAPCIAVRFFTLLSHQRTSRCLNLFFCSYFLFLLDFRP